MKRKEITSYFSRSLNALGKHASARETSVNEHGLAHGLLHRARRRRYCYKKRGLVLFGGGGGGGGERFGALHRARANLFAVRCIIACNPADYTRSGTT